MWQAQLEQLREDLAYLRQLPEYRWMLPGIDLALHTENTHDEAEAAELAIAE